MSFWDIFRRKPQPPSGWTEPPRVYVVALSERVPDVTQHWRGEHLMRIGATSPEEARQQAIATAERFGIVLRETDIIDVRGGERQA